MLIVESIAVATFLMIGVFGATLAVSHCANRGPMARTPTRTVNLKRTTESEERDLSLIKMKRV